MHVVEGRSCAKCGEPIESAKRALACEACALQFHKKCLADKRSCAECGVDLVVAAAERVQQREREARTAIEHGRVVLWLVTGFGASIPLLAGALLWWFADPDVSMRLWRPVVLTAVVFVGIHRGSAGVARGLRALAGVGGLGAIVLGVTFLPTAPLVGGLLLATGANYVVVAAVMALSTDFWLYLEHLREEHQGPRSG